MVVHVRIVMSFGHTTAFISIDLSQILQIKFRNRIVLNKQARKVQNQKKSKINIFRKKKSREKLSIFSNYVQ